MGISECIVLSTAIGNRLKGKLSVAVLSCLLQPVTECPTVHICTVLVPLGMYIWPLLQGRGTYTAHTYLVHTGRLGSGGTLCRCVGMPSLLRVPWWHCFILYLMEVFIRFSFVLTTVSKAFGYRICFIKVIGFSFWVSKQNVLNNTWFLSCLSL